MAGNESFGGRAGGAIGGPGYGGGGGTGVSAAKPSMGELAAQIRLLATQAASSQTYSHITSLLDPIYDLFQRSEKKDPSLAEKVTDWAFDTSRRMQQNARKNAQKFIDTEADGAKKIADTVLPGSSKIISDLLHDPKNLFV
jgi:hypothetical protein